MFQWTLSLPLSTYTMLPRCVSQRWQDSPFIPFGKALFGRGRRRFSLRRTTQLNITIMFGQQSFQTLPRKFIYHNRWYSSMPEFFDVWLCHSSIAQLPRHFCAFTYCPTSLSLGWRHVSCHFPWTASSHEKR